jgi:hypothetical protein
VRACIELVIIGGRAEQGNIGDRGNIGGGNLEHGNTLPRNEGLKRMQ